MENKFQYIYEFNSKQVDGRGDMKTILGGKGAGLAAMSRAGLPVPPGFTISTEACALFLKDPECFSREVFGEVQQALARLEEVSGKRFGADSRPLLVSVRSGASVSMPGMMDTVLNLGLNDETVVTLAEETQNHRFAYDSYRRLLQMFGDVVLGIHSREFERVLSNYKAKASVAHEIELPPEQLESICRDFQKIMEEQKTRFPQTARDQLEQAVEAVFKSWQNPRAVIYRRLNDIPDDLGTAVTVQTMVFGNLGERSGSGVGFTRSPSTGERQLYGEFLFKAQGEEVVAGTRTPLPFRDLKERHQEIYEQLADIAQKLEDRYREMQDFEFTIEDGKLFMLQTRDGKRTGPAAVKIALDMFDEKLISLEEALLRVQPDQIDQLLHPVFKENDMEIMAEGLPASPGAAVGSIVFSADEAVRCARQGKSVILVRAETTPDDIHGMEAAAGIVTSRGGMTSHAAVVARGMGKCAVVGCESLQIDEDARLLSVNGQTLREGDVISLDGTRGAVINAALERIEVGSGGALLDRYMGLIDKVPGMRIRANADTPRDAAKARQFGAVGIGLCRTEHMFFGEERLPIMQQLVVARNTFEREQALEKLKTFQREDFRDILKVMDELPVTIRLLDPPLHEFLPRRSALHSDLKRLQEMGAAAADIAEKQRLLDRLDELEEVNPMLGHRGCRLGITYPEITRMQVEALFEGACDLKTEGHSPVVEVMIPLVSLMGEFENQAAIVRATARKVCERAGVEVPFLVGTMIELPRAALIADQLAADSDFFSFGTNDLTQTTFGFSRDDSARFIKIYEEQDILARDPFQTIDIAGVGELVRMGVERGRGRRPDIKIGICGEHGGDPKSIVFCHTLGMDYVSCSPFRVPGARLAAAQAGIRSASL